MKAVCSTTAIAALALLALPNRATAQDWPQFHGPERNLKTTSTNFSLSWPGNEPVILWKKEVGTGWSGPVVAGDRLIQHHRLGDDEVVSCLDALSGEPRWEMRQPTGYRDQFGFDNGPRATPAIRDGKVFTFGAEGRINCLSLADGTLQWSVDARKELGADLGFFGLDSSPLVEDGRLFLQIGGSNGRGVVALNAGDGRLIWNATDHEAGYSSPVGMTLAGHRTVICFTREGLVGLDSATGVTLLEFPWKSRDNNSVNAASPVVFGNDIFLSASYGTGAVVLRASDGNIRPVWRSDDKLSSHYATSVHHRNLLFGFHGRVDVGPPAQLRALDARTGSVVWSVDLFKPGTLMLVNDTLLILSETGELIAGAATAREFIPEVQVQILGKDTRAHPAFAQGIFYARDKNRLVAVDLRKAGK